MAPKKGAKKADKGAATKPKPLTPAQQQSQKDALARKLGSQPLPRKEGEQFKALIKLHESRMFKKALKSADQILKKFPEHGETLAMKGLILQVLGRKEEAHKIAKRGVENNPASSVSWHIRAIMHRVEKNYAHAQTCFAKAIRYDSGDENAVRLTEPAVLYRDLSFIQLQQRDLEGFKLTRESMVRARPALKVSWIALMVANHLIGDTEKAIIIIDEYIDTLERNSNKSAAAEDSQVLLYRLTMLMDAGLYERALASLEKHASRLLDKTRCKELQAEILLKLNRPKESEGIYRMLIMQNQENTLYTDGLKQALGLTADDRAEQYKLYKELRQQFPRSQAFRVAPLALLTGDSLENEMRRFLEQNIAKGVPTAFQNLKIFYKSKSAGSEQVKVVEKILLEYDANVDKSNKIDLGEDDECLPASRLFVDYYLALHYDLVGDWANALLHIDRAIAHTPTLVDLYTSKGKILKHAGSVREAMDVVDHARALDTADRFLNSVAVKYMLRAGEIALATETIELFTKESPSGKSNLVEMQCMWFHAELGDALVRQGDLAKALKTYLRIDKCMDEFLEDQFDFHQYCMYKMTLSSYISTLRYEDKLRSCTEYVMAAVKVINICLRILYKPKDAGEKSEEAAKLEKERKKALSKQRRANAKLAHVPAAVKKEEKDKKDKTVATTMAAVVEDPDPDGRIFFEEVEKDPLDLATRMLRPLLTLCDERIETHTNAFEVYAAKRKVLPMLRALLRMQKIDEGHAMMAPFLVRFNQIYAELKSTLPDVFRKVVERGLLTLHGDLSLPAKIASLEQNAKESKSLLGLWNIYCAQVELGDDKSALLAKTLSLPDVRHPTYNEAVEIYEGLTRGKRLSDEGVAAQWSKSMSSFYARATCFGFMYEQAPKDDRKEVE